MLLGIFVGILKMNIPKKIFLNYDFKIFLKKNRKIFLKNIPEIYPYLYSKNIFLKQIFRNIFLKNRPRRMFEGQKCAWDETSDDIRLRTATCGRSPAARGRPVERGEVNLCIWKCNQSRSLR